MKDILGIHFFGVVDDLRHLQKLGNLTFDQLFLGFLGCFQGLPELLDFVALFNFLFDLRPYFSPSFSQGQKDHPVSFLLLSVDEFLIGSEGLNVILVIVVEVETHKFGGVLRGVGDVQGCKAFAVVGQHWAELDLGGEDVQPDRHTYPLQLHVDHSWVLLDLYRELGMVVPLLTRVESSLHDLETSRSDPA